MSETLVLEQKATLEDLEQLGRMGYEITIEDGLITKIEKA